MTRATTFKSFIKTHILPIFAAFVLKVIASSVRWVKNDLSIFKEKLPVIGAFWHGRQLMLAPLFSSRKDPFPIAMLISSHADGKLIANAVSWFGIHAVFGSSSQGGKEALLKMVDLLDEGISVAFTPDGPRGPNQKSKAGVVKLASITGKKVIPVSYGVEKFWRFKSWDGMILPKPFTRGVCLVGAPILVPKNVDGEAFDAYIIKIEESLNALNLRCDSYFSDVKE